MTKQWLPNASYVGVDIADYNNSPEDYAVMERFVTANLDSDSLAELEDESFDLIIMSHVIEHLHHGEAAVGKLARKLRPGGHIYIECPAERSRHFPSAYHTLNFYDDPTHVRIYDLEGVCAAAGLKIVRSGIRHDWLPAIRGITMKIPVHLRCLREHGQLFGPYLWDLLGFAKYAIATRP
jgi:SAM-dependent methyltransferase